MKTNIPSYIYISTLENVRWIEIPQEKQNLLIEWFRKSLLPNLEYNIPELYSRSQIPETTQEQINKIQIAIRNNVDNLNEELHDLIFNSISYEKISKLLQKWIYVESYTTADIRNRADEIIEKTKLYASLLDEAIQSTIKFWIQGILIDVLKTVTNIRETRTYQHQPSDDENPNIILDTQRTGSVLEHQHSSHDYWHPITRIHINLTVEQYPDGHILPERTERTEITSNDSISSEKDLIYESMLESIRNVNDDNAQRIINMYIDHSKLVDEIYTRIKDNYSTEQIKGMVNLITQTSIFDNTTIPENKKEIIDAWFIGFLIPQLIKDEILNPLQIIEEPGGLAALFE